MLPAGVALRGEPWRWRSTAAPLDAAELAEPEPVSLAAAARLSGRSYGAAVRAQALREDADFRAAVDRECATLTPELELKWAALEPVRGQLQFAAADELAEFARARSKSVRGHTLVWHRSVPDWARAALAERADWSLVERYFASVLPRYGDVAPVWDVVNEPIDPKTPDGLRAGPFLAAFGQDYVARALQTARRFAPRARLMINEYGLETDDREGLSRRAALLRLIDRLIAAGAPLDGVGLQAHLDLGGARLSQRGLRAFLAELAARRLLICVSELDVKETDYVLSPQRRDAAVAAVVKAFLDVALDEPRVIGVTTWGLSDRYSWLEVTRADLARHPQAWRDGSGPGVNRGLPLDSSLRPKAMRQAMLAAFRHAGSKTDPSSII